MLAVQVSSAFGIVMEEKLGSVRLLGCQTYEAFITYEGTTMHGIDLRHQSSSCKSFRD